MKNKKRFSIQDIEHIFSSAKSVSELEANNNYFNLIFETEFCKKIDANPELCNLTNNAGQNLAIVAALYGFDNITDKALYFSDRTKKDNNGKSVVDYCIKNALQNSVLHILKDERENRNYKDNLACILAFSNKFDDNFLSDAAKQVAHSYMAYEPDKFGIYFSFALVHYKYYKAAETLLNENNDLATLLVDGKNVGMFAAKQGNASVPLACLQNPLAAKQIDNSNKNIPYYAADSKLEDVCLTAFENEELAKQSALNGLSYPFIATYNKMWKVTEFALKNPKIANVLNYDDMNVAMVAADLGNGAMASFGLKDTAVRTQQDKINKYNLAMHCYFGNLIKPVIEAFEYEDNLVQQDIKGNILPMYCLNSGIPELVSEALNLLENKKIRSVKNRKGQSLASMAKSMEHNNDKMQKISILESVKAL